MHAADSELRRQWAEFMESEAHIHPFLHPVLGLGLNFFHLFFGPQYGTCFVLVISRFGVFFGVGIPMIGRKKCAGVLTILIAFVYLPPSADNKTQ